VFDAEDQVAQHFRGRFTEERKNMEATVELYGRPVLVKWSEAAEKMMHSLAEPLLVEMELYFSCLIRKAVRFGQNAQAEKFASASPKLKIGFRPVMTKVCSVSEVEGEPPLEDFPIVKPEAFVPKRLVIDYKKGQWTGEFSLHREMNA
jgi:hypothetical protein